MTDFTKALERAREMASRNGRRPTYDDGLELGRDYLALHAEHEKLRELATTPIPMLLLCPSCFEPHIDEDEWATRPHRTHLCSNCQLEWRPANVPTVGVQALLKEKRG